MRYPSKQLNDLKYKLRRADLVDGEEKFRHLYSLTALIYPCYQGKDIFEIMKNSTFLEGDLIRLLR